MKILQKKFSDSMEYLLYCHLLSQIESHTEKITEANYLANVGRKDIRFVEFVDLDSMLAVLKVWLGWISMDFPASDVRNFDLLLIKCFYSVLKKKYDFEEVKIKSQKGLLKILPKEKEKVKFIKILKYFVSPHVNVNVPHIEVLNLPRLVEELKNMEAANMRPLKLFDFEHGSIDFIGTENFASTIGSQSVQYFIDCEKKSRFCGKFKFEEIQFDPIDECSKYLFGWYGRQQFSSLNSRTSFFEERVNDVERVKAILIYYLGNFYFNILGVIFTLF